MPGKLSRIPTLVRWLAGIVILICLAAGIALSRMGITPSSRAVPPQPPLTQLVLDDRLGDAAALAWSILGDATRTGGLESARAADAMDALASVATARGSPGDLQEALQWARESVRIRERRCDGDCPELAASLTITSAVLWHLEDYRAALPLAQRALSIRTRCLEADDPVMGHALYMTAEAHRALGEFAVAEKLHRQALAIWQLKPEINAPHVAASLHYIGLIRWTLGDLVGARELIEEALSLHEKNPGPDTRYVASDLNTLGNLAMDMGDLKAAMPLFERAQSIWEKSLGKEDPQVARTLTNKARLLSVAGDDTQAKSLLLRALHIRENFFGGDHYLVARSLADLGNLALDTGDTSEAEKLFAHALEIQEKDPEARGPELAATLNDVARLALKTGDPPRAMNLGLRAETIARDYFKRTSQGLEEKDALSYERVQATGRDAALTALERAPDLPGGVSRLWGEIIRSRATVLDRMIARHHPTPAEAANPPSLAELARHLPTGAALVAFVLYQSPGMRHNTTAASYLAFVLRSDGGQPAMVPIGPASQIDALVEDWRNEAGTDPRLNGDHDAEGRYRQAAGRLRRAIWDPVLPELQGRRIVFVVPDGAVNLVSIATLPGEDGRYLIENGPSIHYLSAERDIAAPHHPETSGHGMLALGGAEFDADPATHEPPDTAFKSAAPACPFFQAMRFDPLPGTRREVEGIASLWNPQGEVFELAGSGATEEAFKRLAPGKKILHLATHGYFLQDHCRSFLQHGPYSEEEVAGGENPMLLSGLVLAAANRRAEVSSAQEDGILTSEEIGALDLSGAEWAVLSGCETAAGQVLAGEGVLGLRRAFQVAGAGTLIMSLWPVDDGAARIWMHHLYQGRLAGLSTLQAVKQASLLMIAAQRSAGRSTHPYFWGAFVAAGDWR